MLTTTNLDNARRWSCEELAPFADDGSGGGAGDDSTSDRYESSATGGSECNFSELMDKEL